MHRDRTPKLVLAALIDKYARAKNGAKSRNNTSPFLRTSLLMFQNVIDDLWFYYILMYLRPI